ncbi:MAG: hypothetical protein DWQ07_12835 [Chloroflexi bacterium]|nr:MAG: hypothetical protein DWQ07_12835 [Chloroflexota bacterium]MBL1196925.1 hypothetical protein [Chloroflexota bacterium]NOH14221.1 hypothetical protein [Chloroflexota bacterium]
MGISDRIAEGLNKWTGLWRLLTLIFVVLAFMGVGNYIYDEIWRRKELTFTILQTFDLGDQFFSGLVVSNSGSVRLSDLRIVISDLGTEIISYNIPGATEPIELISGGPGFDHITLGMPRLSKGNELTIYFLTVDEIILAEPITLSVTSDETAGREGVGSVGSVSVVSTIIVFVAGLFVSVAINILTSKNVDFARRKDSDL